MLRSTLILFSLLNLATAWGSLAPPDWKANVNFVNFSSADKDKVEIAISIMERVIKSAEFKDRIINYSYDGKKAFVDNKGKTNAEIYQTLINGSEEINPGVDHTMNVELELYHETTKTIGYTYPNTNRIWMNKKYFSRYTPIKVADNLTHEWLHKLGFTHDVKWSKSRDHTVPYAIGYIMEELAHKFEQENQQ